ncbi:primosomal protein N' [Desulfococcaceae bacterium HSG9]|nr:primosomal protein N' [Desulfococcaceae bacterium HSG9]
MPTLLHHIEIAVALPIDATFTYALPETLVPFARIGMRVLVPFQKRQVTGYILGAAPPITGVATQWQIKNILDIPDETVLFPEAMIPFFKWIADYYCYPLGEVIHTALPGGLNTHSTTVIALTNEGVAALKQNILTPVQKKMALVLENRACPLKKLKHKLNQDISHSLIHTMLKKGWLEKRQECRGRTLRLKTEPWVRLICSDIPSDQYFSARQKIIRILETHREISLKQLKTLTSVKIGLAHFLNKNGYIEIFNKQVYRDPFGETVTPDKPRKLTCSGNCSQKQVVDTISRALGKGFASFLLAGVTGSGKTEVYMHLTAKALKRGESVLVLVPEIALIAQASQRFRARFGKRIAVLHSALSQGERYDQWIRILKGQVVIVIGARSAIFAPFEKIGLIIVDEEHDTSYKQDSGLHYNSRDMAMVRAKRHGAVVLLGSATPSIQSCYNAATNKYTLTVLTERIEKRPLPEIAIVDLRKARDMRGINRFITAELRQAMAATLAQDEQVLLFLNRRGFANYPVCSACGEALQCQNCAITLTMHKRIRAYKCHYCGFTRPALPQCPTCGSSALKLLGYGTELVEEAVKAIFPDARVARMDRDTTQRKGSILKLLKGLHDRTTDILIGTQMVAKGHDFPYITLVGIICADLSLNVPDFRAGEQTFQILAQVAGRAGRGASPGKVILQTYNPDHFSVIAAKKQDYQAFYDEEINCRKSVGFPPFTRLIQLKITGVNPRKVSLHAQAVGEACYLVQSTDDSLGKHIAILGPAEAPIARIDKRYRWQILLKGADSIILHDFIRRLLGTNKPLFTNKAVKVVIDVDPVFMM